MEFIKAYTFDTIEQAEAAIQAINNAFGIRYSPEAVTQTYTNYELLNDVYIIRHLAEIEPILGQPIEIEYESN
jgi:hypothetical protein